MTRTLILLAIFLQPLLTVAFGSAPERYGKLLFSFNEQISQPGQIVDLLKLNQDRLVKTLENVCAQPLIAYNTDKHGDNVEEFPVNELDFVVKHSVIKGVNRADLDALNIPGKGKLFAVSIPYVLKGSRYKVVNRQVLVQNDQQAAEIRIYVDNSGKVYW